MNTGRAKHIRKIMETTHFEMQLQHIGLQQVGYFAPVFETTDSNPPISGTQ